MAEFNQTSVDRTIVSAGSMGNASVNTVKYPSVGALVAGTDKFYVTKIPKGSVITDLIADAEAGLSLATGTLNIGYIMGGTEVADYFAATANTVTGGRFRSVGAPLECTDDCYIVIAPATANTVVNKQLDVTVNYEFQGQV